MCGCDRPTATLCTPKPTNITELKAALLSIWNDLPQESLITQSCHFERDFDSVLLQLADTLNIQFKHQLAFIIETFEVLVKSCASLIRYLIRITEYSGRDCMFTIKWTLKFNVVCLLNHICYFNNICKICGPMNHHL